MYLPKQRNRAATGWPGQPRRRRLRVALTPGALAVFGLAFLGPWVIFFAGDYPGTLNSVGDPCRLVSAHTVRALDPRVVAVDQDGVCLWSTTPSKSETTWEVQLDPIAWPPGDLPFQTAQDVAHQQYVQGAQGWAPISGVGDEAGMEKNGTWIGVRGRTANVVWEFVYNGSQHVPPTRVLACAHEVARNLSDHIGPLRFWSS